MGLLSLSLFIFMPLLFLLSQFHLILADSSPFIQPLCHHDDSSALLQFKEETLMIIDEPSCLDVTASWTIGDKSDCCSWDGVECDEATGHVIVLDLSGRTCFFGSINPSSSLFRLVHLQSLNLAYNNFNYSQIPSQLGNLSRLTHLNLCSSYFSGQIPLEISQLSHLSSLDLSKNYHLELKKASLTSLVGNLTRLQKLNLSHVDISSHVPNILANLSSLTFLSLRHCRLRGKFPVDIFKLSNIQFLDVGGNEGLIGHLPGFTWGSPLQTLDLSETKFSGELPISMGNLVWLTKFSIYGCNFSGSIPPSLGNLTKLTELYLSNNFFVGNIPPSLGNLTKLIFLRLSSNAFVGNLPPSLGNLTKLYDLELSNNVFVGNIPPSLGNLVELVIVDISHNQLTGPIPFGLLNLPQLQTLDLKSNQLSGPVTFRHIDLPQLYDLDLSANKIHGQISNTIFSLESLVFVDLSENYINGIAEFDEFDGLKRLTQLDISRNQLTEFPKFLRNQIELDYLNLSNNKIHGQVPEWMWNTGNNLQFLDLSNNLLTGFWQDPIFLVADYLQVFDLRSNLLQGSLPIPPVSTSLFYISNNKLVGNIPELFCNLSSVLVIDLANNSLSGSLPRCSDNFGTSLSILDLGRNKFRGSIPKTWIGGSKLMIINLSKNKFQGHLSRSLAKCTMLKVLDLSGNQFIGRFPFWLGHLPSLEVLRLRSNKFNGPMGTPQTNFKFPNLQILDISYNDFIGELPLKLFENWKARNFENVHQLKYIQVLEISGRVFNNRLPAIYTYSMTMTNKGKNMLYEKVEELFTAIDFSSNRFVGEIPESVGNLKGAQLLNLSNNALIGNIPSSLGNLTEMEALDLSQNKLSGEIPQQLTQLTFLGFLNVSYNTLMGPIPQGRQFDTFENNSFEGNPRLCGRPLTRKCENSNELPSQPSILEEKQHFGLPFEFGWKIVVIGYGFGFVVGVIIGQIVIRRKYDWLMKTLRIRPLSGRRRKN